VEIETQVGPKQVTLRIRGRVTRADGERLKQAVLSLLKRGHLHFVVDFHEVSDIDSFGLGGLVAANAAVHRSNGSFRVEAWGRMRDLLVTTKLLDVGEPSSRHARANLLVGVAVAVAVAVLLWTLTQ
jgi:anti-anti-sigma factor